MHQIQQTGKARVIAAFERVNTAPGCNRTAGIGRSGTLETLAAIPPLVTELRVVSNGALKSKQLPDRIKILNAGTSTSTKGDIVVGQRTLDKMEANQRSLGFERVAVDYNHCSAEGCETNKQLLSMGRPPLIFGYGRPHVIAGDGIYLEQMEWTPLGVESAKQFEDISPAVHQDGGEVDFIHSVALTPNGCVHDLTFFSAIAGGANALKGRGRLVAALERENANRGLNRLSATEAGALVSTRPGSKENAETVAAPVGGISANAMGEAVFAMMEEDFVGPDARAALRRLVSRKVNEAWLQDQQRRPGGRTAAAYAKFQEDIDNGTAAAVRSFARLKLTKPVDMMVEIAAARGSPSQT
jgi:hypothetical protein